MGVWRKAVDSDPLRLWVCLTAQAMCFLALGLVNLLNEGGSTPWPLIALQLVWGAIVGAAGAAILIAKWRERRRTVDRASM